MIANNDGWIEWAWTEDKPYPESLATRVVVMFRDGTCATHHTDTVEWWYSEEVDANNWYNSGGNCDIVGYRVVN